MLNPSGRTGPSADAEEIMDTLTRLFNKAAIIEREPVDTGDGVPLFTSEIHLIDMAGRFPEEGISSLASRLGITKGAVSQTAKKLEEKGYLERMNVEGNNKTVCIRLTESGKQAYEWHRSYHAVVNEKIAEQISCLEEKDVENIRNLLLRLENVFDECPETRRRITGDLLKGCLKKP